METRIREARVDDAAELAVLSTELGYPSTTDDIQRRLPFLLSNPGHLVLVATDVGDGAVGWLHAVVPRGLESDGFVEIAGLVVADAHRSSGIGSRLLAAAERWAVGQTGVGTIRVRSNVIRQRAHRFYLRAGYTLAKTSHLFTKQLG
jgi:GNAT superfamily N-acetyltransferase